MMNDILAETLSNHLGRQLFHWAVAQSDIWYLAYRCADFVTKIHEPLERGVAVLDSLLTLEDEEISTYEELIYMENNAENQQILRNYDNSFRGKTIWGLFKFKISNKNICNFITIVKVSCVLSWFCRLYFISFI